MKGKTSSNIQTKRKKLSLTFNDDARKEYLTGFRKRRQERKVKAQDMLEKKLKDKIRQERNKRRKKTQEKVDKLLEGMNVPGEEVETEHKCEKVDFGTHEAIVKTCIDFGESGLILAPSQHDEGAPVQSQAEMKERKKNSQYNNKRNEKEKKKTKQKKKR